jgi:hypothetical protein
MWVGGCHAPAALPPGMTRYPLYRWLGRPQSRAGRVWKNSPPPGFDPRTAQAVASRCTDLAIPARLQPVLPCLTTQALPKAEHLSNKNSYQISTTQDVWRATDDRTWAAVARRDRTQGHSLCRFGRKVSWFESWRQSLSPQCVNVALVAVYKFHNTIASVNSLTSCQRASADVKQHKSAKASTASLPYATAVFKWLIWASERWR